MTKILERIIGPPKESDYYCGVWERARDIGCHIQGCW